MNDTHGQQGEGWIGFDLDGTLAKYDGWKGIDHIGEPVKPMVDLIKRMHDEGKVVKIMTARVAPKEKPEVKPNPYLENHWVIESPDDMPWAVHAEAWTPREFIQDWCYRYLGFVPDVVYQKDHLMLELYDDRCHQVVPNTGEVVEEQRDELAKALEKKEVYVVHDMRTVDIRWVSRILLFLTGLCFGATLVFWLEGWLTASSVGEKERKLHEAIHEYMGELAHVRAHGYVERVSGAVVP